MDQKISISIYGDGGARGNPGPAAVGVVIKNKQGAVLYELGKKIGHSTNNVAEYQAVIEGLLWVKKQHKSFKINFFVDSKLVACQLSGLYKVKNANLRELIFKIRILEQEVGGDVSYQFIPREKNQEADRLVNLALDDRI